MNVTMQRKFMKIALEEAKLSLREGNKGFGAVIAKGTKILIRTHDTDITDNDPTAHAETKAVRSAFKQLGGDLSGCVMFATHEPCPMCSGAIVWSRIPHVVYSVSIRDSLKMGRTMVDVRAADIFRKAPWKIKCEAGLLKNECAHLYESSVRASVKQLRPLIKNNAWKKLERERSLDRVSWFKKNKTELLGKLHGTDIEKAYQLLLLRLRIKPSDAPIVARTEKKITFRSRNFCPTIYACDILGLDTRVVCRAAYEKSTGDLLRQINPRLKFGRNYAKLRPHSPYCEEFIILK